MKTLNPRNEILSATRGDKVEFFYVINPEAAGGLVNGDDSKILIWNEHSHLLDVELDPYGSFEDVRAVTRSIEIRFVRANGLLKTATQVRPYHAEPSACV